MLSQDLAVQPAHTMSTRLKLIESIVAQLAAAPHLSHLSPEHLASRAARQADAVLSVVCPPIPESGEVVDADFALLSDCLPEGKRVTRPLLPPNGYQR